MIAFIGLVALLAAALLIELLFRTRSADGIKLLSVLLSLPVIGGIFLLDSEIVGLGLIGAGCFFAVILRVAQAAKNDD